MKTKFHPNFETFCPFWPASNFDAWNALNSLPAFPRATGSPWGWKENRFCYPWWGQPEVSADPPGSTPAGQPIASGGQSLSPLYPPTPLVGARNRDIVCDRCWGGLSPELEEWENMSCGRRIWIAIVDLGFTEAAWFFLCMRLIPMHPWSQALRCYFFNCLVCCGVIRCSSLSREIGRKRGHRQCIWRSDEVFTT